MAYLDVADMAKDPWLKERITACAAKEGVVVPHPTQWADDHQWQLAASPGWEEAWQYARVVGEVDHLGLDEGVISDSMILSAVQHLRSQENAAE